MLEKPLIINDWQKGIGASDYVGFGDMRAVDVFSRPGIVRTAQRPIKMSGTTIDDLPKKIILNGSDQYAITDDKVWKYTIAGGWTQITGSKGSVFFVDIAIWKTFLMVFRSGMIDIYDMAGTQGWVNNWKLDAHLITINTNIHAFIGSDDKLYWSVSHYIESLAEVAGQTYDPNTAGTFTLSSANAGTAALNLPTGYITKVIDEIGGYLQIVAYNANLNRSDIFPWNKTDPSYSRPKFIAYDVVYTAIAINNLMYIIGGYRGTIWVTDGTSIQAIKELPDSLTNLYNNYASSSILVYPHAIAYFNNKIYFGTTTLSGSPVTPALIWSFDPVTNGLSCEALISTGNIGTDIAKVTIGCLTTYYGLLIGWKDSVAIAQGIDRIGVSSHRYTGYASYIISAFYSMAEKYKNLPLATAEIQLVKPLITGEGIKFYYRTAQNGSWTQIGSTWEYISGSIDNQSKSFPIGHLKPENVQFKVEMQSAASSSASPELLLIKIK